MGRLRNNPNALKLINNHPNYIDLKNFKILKEPTVLEIGCGKGDFLIENAKSDQKTMFVGIEKCPTIILKALTKISHEELQLQNLLFTNVNAEQINLPLFKNKIAKIYLNFSDPWPKKRHSKRRLTSPNFLLIYKKILKQNGVVELKTDNEGLYNYSLDVFKQRKDIKIIYKTRNLYSNLNNKFNLNNIQTEYEKKFIKMNKTIFKIIFKFKN